MKHLWPLALLLLGVLASAQAQVITITKTAFPAGEVGPGDAIDYTVTVANPFASDLAIGFFEDIVPEGTTYIPGTLTLDPFVPDVLWYFQGSVFNTGDLLLPALGQTRIEFSVEVDSGVPPGSQIVNIASTDFGLSNPTFNTVAARAELFSVLDVDPPGVISPGEVLTYTLTIFNFGFTEATGVQILAPIPAFTTYEQGSLSSTSGSFLFDAGNNRIASAPGGIAIAPGGGLQVSYQARVDDPIPNDTIIVHRAAVDGILTNTVRNFTVTLSDYINLEQIPGNVLVTDGNAFDQTGWAIAGGDFDNDGAGDLIIGDPLANDEGFRSGLVHIVYGGFLLSDTVILPDTGAATTQIHPPAGAHRFGNALAVGDFTGDGIDDLLIGAPGLSLSGTPGHAYLIQGGDYQNIIDLSGPDSPRAAITGVGTEELGWTAAAGDFDGDGIDDLILGAPLFAPTPTDPLEGRVVVIPGGPGLPATVDMSAPPANVSQILGDPVDEGIAQTSEGLAAGDANGDGRDEIAVGAVLATTPPGGEEAGKVFVVLGSSTPVVHDLAGSPDGWVEIQSEFASGRMGWSLDFGDLNGDGFDDLAIGAPFASWRLLPDDVVFSNAGVVFGLAGRSDISAGVVDLGSIPRRNLLTVFGEFSADYLGVDVSFGDHNGDGFDELMMGAPYGYNAYFSPVGVAHMLLGTTRLRPQYLLPFAPTGTLRFYADEGSEAAFQTLGAGDMNTDGFADLFLGDTVSDPAGSGATDSDETHVFFGKPRAPRIELAIASEIGVADRSLTPGEQIILQFDQPVLVTPALLQAGDFFLTNPGASVGGQALLAPNPNDLTQAIIVLGFGFQGIVVDGVDGGSSTRIDIGANARPLIRSVLTNLVAEDTGLINTDDRGVDIVWGFETVPTPIAQASGGVVDVTDNADSNRPNFAYTRHRLEIPAGSLSGDTGFAIARPPQSLSDLNLPSAVQITDNDPGVPSFAQPATLTLEYRDEDVYFATGAVESLFRIYQVIESGSVIAANADRPRTRILPTGQVLREVSGTQTVDTETNTVSVQIGSLDPEGSTSEAGTFVTLPANPVEERTIHIAPATGGSLRQATVPMLAPGPTSVYALHRVEFPGFTAVAPGTPGSTRVTIRATNLFERAFASRSDANIFPQQSAAVFTVTTADAAGSPVAFSGPVNVRVHYFARPNSSDTDVVDFSSVAGEATQMRVVHTHFSTSAGSNYQYVERNQSADTSAGTITVEGLTGLTGASGIGVIGAVVDPRVEPITLQEIIDFLLGRATLSVGQRALADTNADATVDIADVVRFVNSSPTAAAATVRTPWGIRTADRNPLPVTALPATPETSPERLRSWEDAPVRVGLHGPHGRP